MTIPSPRKFIETIAIFIAASFFMAGFVFVVFVMAVFAVIEWVVDRVRLLRKARR
jgi:hypothetical protein